MSTSVTTHKPDPRQKLILIDLLASLFCALLGAVYEVFSHGVYSYGMIYAFVFPLVLGVLPLLLIEMLHATYPGSFARNVFHAGIAALTVGSLVTGALEIYGTSNPLTTVYWIAGIMLTLLGVSVYLICIRRNTKQKAS